MLSDSSVSNVAVVDEKKTAIPEREFVSPRESARIWRDRPSSRVQSGGNEPERVDAARVGVGLGTLGWKINAVASPPRRQFLLLVYSIFTDSSFPFEIPFSNRQLWILGQAAVCMNADLIGGCYQFTIRRTEPTPTRPTLPMHVADLTKTMDRLRFICFHRLHRLHRLHTPPIRMSSSSTELKCTGDEREQLCGSIEFRRCWAKISELTLSSIVSSTVTRQNY